MNKTTSWLVAHKPILTATNFITTILLAVFEAVTAENDGYAGAILAPELAGVLTDMVTSPPYRR